MSEKYQTIIGTLTSWICLVFNLQTFNFTLLSIDFVLVKNILDVMATFFSIVGSIAGAILTCSQLAKHLVSNKKNER